MSAHRPDSPAAFDENSPSINRKDKSYRRYASNVERALSLFDTTLQEWADYIAFLGRLLKALQLRPANTVEIPHKALVAKRLSQCLDPSLPPGVHQKTLEVYAFVFSILDRDGLSEDLPLYLPGLSATLSFASLSVKPALLSLFENYILFSHPRTLRSALKAIILAVLPALEDETSEEFERTLNLLNKFKSAVRETSNQDQVSSDPSGDQCFWQTLFLASITSPSRRPGALAYLSRELPILGKSSAYSATANGLESAEESNTRSHTPPEIEAVTAPEPGLLIRCFVAGLQDEQLLIQRGFLDLLVTHLPLRSAFLQQKIVSRDLELLVAAATSVVARREMSLNRRLWAWLLGPEVPSGVDESAPSTPVSPDARSIGLSSNGYNFSQVEYFEKYGLEPLVGSLLGMISNDVMLPTEKARPFRICSSLMDRWEIGGLVVPRVFRPAMEVVWRYQRTAPSKEALSEILRSASVFFDGIESSLIWAELVQILLEALRWELDTPDSEDKLDFVLFVITNFNIREEEMLALHVPLATLLLMSRLREFIEKHPGKIKPKGIKSAFTIASQLLDLMPQRTFASRVFDTANTHEHMADEKPGKNDHKVIGMIEQYYHKVQKGEETISPINDMDMKSHLLHNTIQIVLCELIPPIQPDLLHYSLPFLKKLLHKAHDLDDRDYEDMVSQLMKTTEEVMPHAYEISFFGTITTLIYALETVHGASRSGVWHSDRRIRQILPTLLTGLWPFLSPSSPRYSVEAVRSIWRIHSISPDSQLVEGSITTLMLRNRSVPTSQNVELEGARRFAALWAHSDAVSNSSSSRNLNETSSGRTSADNALAAGNPTVLVRPLLLLLDSLCDTQTQYFFFTVSWLQSLPNIHRISDVIVCQLHRFSYFSDTKSTPETIDECLYYLQAMLNLIKYSATNVLPSLSRGLTPTDTSADDHKSSTPSKLESLVSDEETLDLSVHAFLMQGCLRILNEGAQGSTDVVAKISQLRQTSVQILQHILVVPSSATGREPDLIFTLIKTLSRTVDQDEILLQAPLMDLVLTVIRKQTTDNAVLGPQRRDASREAIRSVSQISLSSDKGSKGQADIEQKLPEPALLDCLIFGISSSKSYFLIEQWIHFLEKCLPFYAVNIFQVLMPLVDCFSKKIETVFQSLRAVFEEALSHPGTTNEPIAILNALFNGLEKVLERGHDQLIQEEGRFTLPKSPEQVQGFFGTMVSGVFAPEAQKSRSTTANNRLTVLLCFKDAVRVSFSLWSWGDVGLGDTTKDPAAVTSFNFTSLRLRNRTRRLLEHLFAAEALECTETLIEFWQSEDPLGIDAQSSTVFNLLHALKQAQPRDTTPALFNAIYSRTNPNVLDPVRKSTLTSELSDVGLANFLVAYTKSMDDDALDEIWTDCMTFLRDVVSNPLPHRQTLPLLLEFTAVLGEKIGNTNIGEQRKMRRDIGDLFIRLLTAAFATKPLVFSQVESLPSPEQKPMHEISDLSRLRKAADSKDVTAVIASILPKISKVLVDTDRITAFMTTISSQILTPTVRWKTFPRNMTKSTLKILSTMSRIPESSKIWRKDVAEAFNDPRFFATGSFRFIEDGWMPILRQWTLLEKDRTVELLSRLTSPTSAGIMFGVGATSARLEADRKTQLNLRRIATLFLSADTDAFMANLGGVQEKLVDVMTATSASSPSSATRAETYMVLRAIVLKNSPVHLSSFWPVINTELYDALSSLKPSSTTDIYNIPSALQAAKLLDTLLVISPEDFQLCEWLFVTDTIDAVYRPSEWNPVALVDGLAEGLDNEPRAVQNATVSMTSAAHGLRKPLLIWDVIKDIPKESLVDSVLRPFLRQLSINAFENTYRMGAPDRQACCDDVLRDIFDDTTLV